MFSATRSGSCVQVIHTPTPDSLGPDVGVACDLFGRITLYGSPEAMQALAQAVLDSIRSEGVPCCAPPDPADLSADIDDDSKSTQGVQSVEGMHS